jgi:hypothetical protein
MAWYKKASKSIFAPTSESVGKSQKRWNANLGDYQRWVVDAYEASVYITQTDYKIAVAVTVNKIHLGTIMLQMFWKYSLKEEKAAEKTYKEVCKAVGKVFDELSDTESPSSLYESMIRHDCSKIDKEHMAKTNNPIINYSQDVKYERDWRSSIYGNRYPKPGEFNEFS